jgi:hypothetical protein
MHFKYKNLIIFCLTIFSGYTYASEANLEGFYIGGGSGLNITSNKDLIKGFSTDNVMQLQKMGDVTGYSVPIFAFTGYRFNEYIAAEFAYSYSGNQTYERASREPKGPGFWGSQSIFSMNAIGYYPLITNSLYLKGRAGIAYSMDTLTTYPGNPGTKNFTSVLGAGLQYYVRKNISIDFDYVNYGILAPMKLEYTSPIGSLGTVDSITSNQFLLSASIHF